MTEAYDPELRALAAAAGRDVGLTLREGVYAGLAGAAVRDAGRGAHAARRSAPIWSGMSTVPEVIVAAHMGARVLGLSCCTNLAAGVTGEKLSHAEVTETAARVRDQFIALLVARSSSGWRAERMKRRRSMRRSSTRRARCAPTRHAPYSRYQRRRGGARRQRQASTPAPTSRTRRTGWRCAPSAARWRPPSPPARSASPRVAVVTATSPPAAPCGMCRQVLAEFAGDELPVALVNDAGERSDTTLGALLPHAFRSDDLT